MIDIPQIDAALGQFADNNLPQPAQTRRVFSRERDLVLFVKNFGDASLEIEPCGQFFARLIKRIIDLLIFYF